MYSYTLQLWEGYRTQLSVLHSKKLELNQLIQRLSYIREEATQHLNAISRIEFIKQCQKSLSDYKIAYEKKVYPLIQTVAGEIASRIYGDIRIEIKDKTITVFDNGIEKDFFDTCNKGLKDIVALSLRLALLKVKKAAEKGDNRRAFSFIILDEVTAFLDRDKKREIAEYLREIVPYAKQVIIVTHDDEILHTANTIIRLTKGDNHETKVSQA
jgi:DNA repair exonuclease SbcCD ATPase subunit